MQRAVRILRKGFFAPAAVQDRVVLDFDARHRRRTRLLTSANRDVLLDLDMAAHIRDGDGLVLTDGSLVLVTARAEPLFEITARDRDLLVRIAWHLGNRHLPVQLAAGALRIRADHVIAQMVRGLGGEVSAISAPFDPEGGAYDHGAVPSDLDDALVPADHFI